MKKVVRVCVCSTWQKWIQLKVSWIRVLLILSIASAITSRGHLDAESAVTESSSSLDWVCSVK